MRIPQSAERLKEAPAQVLRAVMSKATLPKEVPAQQALRSVLSKEAPAQALRAVFSGVGQVLLATEKVRRRAMGEDQQSAAPAAATAETATQAPPVAGTVTAGTVPSAAVKTAAPEPAAAAKPTASTSAPDKASSDKASTSTAKTGTAKASTAKASTPKASTPKASAAKASKEKAGPSTAKPGASKAGSPPIPQYSDLSVASLRARMRGLDAAQLGELISYERAHENRETVIAMFERRIAKLQQEGPGAAG